MLHDIWVIARRGLIHMKRQPEALSDATIQPIMFVLLFAYVFGGAIEVPGGGSYREFLMGGIFAQTIVFTAFGVALSIANDRKNQAVDRFRSLPIANGAVLGGHAVANLIKALLPDRADVDLRADHRLAHPQPASLERRQRLPAPDRVRLRHDLGRRAARQPGGHARGRHRASPSPCCSRSRSSPARSCPSARCRRAAQAIAEWNPVTTLADALRDPVRQPEHPDRAERPVVDPAPVAYTWIWIVGIVVACAPLAVRAYRRSITS